MKLKVSVKILSYHSTFAADKSLSFEFNFPRSFLADFEFDAQKTAVIRALTMSELYDSGYCLDPNASEPSFHMEFEYGDGITSFEI